MNKNHFISNYTKSEISVYAFVFTIYCMAYVFVHRRRRCALCHLLTVKCSSMFSVHQRDELIKMLTFIIVYNLYEWMYVYFQLNSSIVPSRISCNEYWFSEVSTILDFSSRKRRKKTTIPIYSKPHFIFTNSFNSASFFFFINFFIHQFLKWVL